MNLDLNRITEEIEQNDFIKNFIKELSVALENFSHQKELKGEKMDDIKLTEEEDLQFYRKKSDFLQEYFKLDSIIWEKVKAKSCINIKMKLYV